MKAIRFHEYGEADVLRYEDAATPIPDAGQVRVRVAGTTFNGIDGSIRRGNMQKEMPLTLPHIPGVDVAGTIDSLGDGVDNVQVGDAVIGFLPFVTDGASAEFVVAPADALAPAPTSIPLADSAVLGVAGLTAWQALFDHAKLKEGQRILVNGAGGAVGGFAVQLARAAGAYVIATGRPASADHLRTLGADEVIDRTAVDVIAAVTDPVDVLLNLAPVTPDRLTELGNVVADGGIVVNTTVWMPAPSDEARGVRGIDMYQRSDATQLSELAARVDRGELVVEVADRVPLRDLATVHARSDDRTLTGKVVVVPGD